MVKEILGNLVSSSINYFMSGMLQDAVNLFSTQLANIMSAAIDFLETPMVHETIIYSQGIAAVFLVSRALLEIIQQMIAVQYGDYGDSLAAIFIRMAKACAMVCCAPWLTVYVWKIGSSIAMDIAQLSGDVSMANLYSKSGATAPLLLNLMLIISLIFVLLIYVQTFIRAAEIAMLAAISPIVGINLISQDSGAFREWLQKIIAISMSQGVQIFMLKLSMSVLGGGSLESIPGQILMFLAVLWATIQSPKLVAQFSHSSGIGGFAGSSVMSIGKMALRRAA